MTEVLLKARPTRAQLADRLAAPVPPGLELYLDARDVNDLERLERLAHRLNDLRPNRGFAYIVEGPLRSIDGSFFDISVDSEAQRECVRRIAWLAAEIRAEAVLVHAIAPRRLSAGLTEEMHEATLRASLPFIQHYVEIVQAKGTIPMLENIPPVARQREAAYMCTPVGMRAGDLVFFAKRFPGLMATVDVSHAELFLNGLRLAGDRGRRDEYGNHRDTESTEKDRGRKRDVQDEEGYSGSEDRLAGSVHPSTSRSSREHGDLGELEPLVRYLVTVPDEPTMEAYLSELEPYLFEAHISNARGLLEEGLSYGDGDLEMDGLAVRLSRSCRYLVTETIEPDADHGAYMREAQRRLEAALRKEF